jgi:outer membrane protein assembly factor BamD (BamD/ComL family)
VEGLIERDRNRAARLFLAARQATDPDQKDQYLRASFDILQALVEKYPTSPLIAKVRAHRDRVREEMERR